MILTIISGIYTIYKEIKWRENGEKIFYTFYIVVISVILTMLLSIIDIMEVYIIFTLVYIFLLYGIYTDFQWLSYLMETLFVKNKKINKNQLVKLDYEMSKMIQLSIMDIHNEISKIKIYSLLNLSLDLLFILIGIGLSLLSLFIIIKI